MNRSIVMEMATSMIGFTGFLSWVVRYNLLYFQIKKINPFEIIGIAVTYINANLLFLLALKGLLK